MLAGLRPMDNFASVIIFVLCLHGGYNNDKRENTYEQVKAVFTDAEFAARVEEAA